MILHFFEPPTAKKIGGLDVAIQSLQRFLVGSGVTVQSESTIEEIGESRMPEIVHFHGLWQRKFLGISAHCRRRSIPYVVSPHGMLEEWAWRHKWWKKWPYFYLLEYWHLRKAARLLTTSAAESRNLERFFPRSDRVVLPLGLAERRTPDYAAARDSLGWSKREIVILFLSRIHPKKGLPLLLKALVSLDLHRWPRPIRLVIVGGGAGSYVRGLKAFVEEQTRLPRVNWMGELWGEQKWRYLQGADITCLPSYSENFGFVILESLQVGTRVITTDQTPWDSIPSWNAGWIVRPRVDTLTTAIRQYLAHPEWSEDQRSRLAAETCERYSWEKIGPEYLRFYESIVG